ncbi:MAG: hypothetical protein FWG88_00675 [Oscillospiraceae bacterium]|nr:hypothetical protein [Oscillospiraceae bacterium]
MKVYEKAGPDNTDDACRIAIERAMLMGASIVSATTQGDAGVRLCDIAKEMAYQGQIVIVTHAYGSREPGTNALKEEHREAIKGHGATIVTATHALSGVERGISSRHQGAYPAEIIAHSLRMLSAGIKVVVEISCMALDAGAIEFGKEIVCLGGTGRGLDTAVIMTPAHANKIFETRIHEILCKPY